MKSKTNVKNFLADSEVDGIIKDIEKKISASGKAPLYSDIYKTENGKEYQYVNYVQEGGGVLGVALVGYTYVLEKLGLRFLKLAGTSAGAINTIMLASVDKQNRPEYSGFETKSEIILHEMLNYDLWHLVDGSKFGKFLIKLFINNKWGLNFLVKLFFVSLVTALVSPLLTLFHFASFADTILSWLTVISTAVIILYILLIAIYLLKFDKAGFGINPGNNFKNWIKNILEKNNIRSTDDLNKAMAKHFEDLKLRHDDARPESEANTNIIEPYLTIIASDITNQTKVEFPLMAKEYWKEPQQVNPSDYVRASMSIPVFFSPFKINVNEETISGSKIQQSQLVADQYAKMKAEQKTKHEYMVRFVDGGILSNFPINIFHNPNIQIARMPTLGVKLEDEKHLSGNEIERKRSSFLSFIGRIFNTVRYYYDKDFLKKNEVYEKCIGHIDAEKFNWLDFGLNDETKMRLFKKGAEAARTFFLGGNVWIDGRESVFEAFNWEKFKQERKNSLNNNHKEEPLKVTDLLQKTKSAPEENLS
jgi:NTE family protein